jgi:cytochrome c oxidase cbb3-type subunit III
MKMKNKIAFTLIFLLSLITNFGSAQTPANNVTEPDNSKIVLIAVLSVSIIVLFVLLYLLYALNVFLNAAKKSGDIKETPPMLRLTDAVPIEREHEIMLDHNYDGIQELDNKLPPWWVYLFYGTIVFAFVYMWYYHMYGTGNIQEEEYQQELAQAEVEMKLFASKVDENSVTLLTDAAKLKNGEVLFQTNCAACHGKQGQGGVGPNLTDNYWIHGSRIKEVFKTIKYGVPEKGMIPWQAQLSPGQIQEVSSYIIKLKGTNPPNPKAPQGELTKE